MAAISTLIAGASLAAGIGGSVLSARSAAKQRKAEQEAQEKAQQEAELAARQASNQSTLDQDNSADEDLASFSLGAPGASDSLFKRTRRKASTQGSTATGKKIGGL